VILLALALVPVILWKHRDNIRRLLRREESKV
jgi:glycerol-3-phosphate acyltransferase PlsY